MLSYLFAHFGGLLENLALGGLGGWEAGGYVKIPSSPPTISPIELWGNVYCTYIHVYTFITYQLPFLS